MTATELKDSPMEEVFRRLGTSPKGLSQSEARLRASRYGYNEIAAKEESALKLFLSFFRGTIPYMIIAAAIVSAILGHYPTLIIILTLLFVNAFVGFHEEHQAGNAIAALKKKLAIKATAKRDSKWTEVVARDLVPGDVINLRIGAIIPADARLLAGDPVQVDQSALTGESMPVEHKPGDAVFSGSILKRGEIEAVVYATGSGTFYGKTAQLVESAKTRSHLQIAIMKIANYLLIIAVVLAVLLVAVAFIRHDSILVMLQFVLVLVVAAVPVAMPAVLSITMALGAKKLAEKHAVVTKLSAIEEVAGVDVLCSDKTGTLTQAKLVPGKPFTAHEVSEQMVQVSAALASQEASQDPIDLAVLGGLKDRNEIAKFHVEHYLPFDPVKKRTEALIRASDGSAFRVSKGAPQVILDLARSSNPRITGPTVQNGSLQESETSSARKETSSESGFAALEKEVNIAVDGFAQRGFRSLGVARSDEDGRWHFLGIIPLFDPLRTDSKETVKKAKTLGLQTKMITGDQLAIAKEVASQLELGTNIVNASVLNNAKERETSQMADAIEQADGFAQVFPEHKYHIVDVLQQRNHIVCMTGDGVNDAPALKKADAGIAVAGATDAARSAAAIALLDPGLSVIIEAIRESRRIFERMMSYAIYRIAETVALLGFITIVVLGFHVYPVTAIMIVLLAIINDGSILSIAYDHTRSSSNPQRWHMPFVMGVATSLGMFAVLRSLGVFFLSTKVLKMPIDETRTMIYLNLSVGGILTLYAARTRGPFWSVAPARLLLIITLAAQVIATLLSVYGILMTSIGWINAGLIWAYSLILFLLQDQVKRVARKIFGRSRSRGLVSRTKNGKRYTSLEPVQSHQ